MKKNNFVLLSLIVSSILILTNCSSGSKDNNGTSEIFDTRDSINTIKWHKEFYVDDFGDTTNEAFIKTTTVGTFSNPRDSNEYLYVEIFVDKNSAGLFLHEYKEDAPAETFLWGSEMKMIFKNQAGEILRITNFSEWNNEGGIAINKSSDRSNFNRFLKRGEGKIKVVVEVMFMDRSTYNFTIDATGFTKAYASL